MTCHACGSVGHWLTVRDGDPRALGLFKEHYAYLARALAELEALWAENADLAKLLQERQRG